MELQKIQTLLTALNIDGWLFYDFHNRDHIAYRILGLDFSKTASRRWFYFIPAKGEPVKIMSKVEPGKISVLPGKEIYYLSRIELLETLKTVLMNAKKIAMQYSPNNNIPYVSLVDGGTIDMIKGLGKEVVSSADLIQATEAIIDENGYRLHLEAGIKMDRIRAGAFQYIAEKIKKNERLTDYQVQQWIVSEYKKEGLNCDGDYPIVGVNENAANPHFAPDAENQVSIKKGDRILIDMWSRLDRADGIYYDITWCGYVGEQIPEDYVKIFDIAMAARDRGVEFVSERFARGKDCFGYEVDEQVREVIEKAGYGQYFVHRTGHNIGHEVHGNGVNIDSLETKDSRKLEEGICFSIEPGIYIPGGIGVRTEIDVFIKNNLPVVSGEMQHELVKIC